MQLTREWDPHMAFVNADQIAANSLTRLRGVLSSLHAFRAPLPPPRPVEETDACFIVRDANGQALAYVYAPGVVTADQLGPRRGAKWWPRPRIADQSEVRIDFP